MDYSSNYFKSINLALKNAKYKSKKDIVDNKTFFEIINSKINRLRDSRNRLFFLGNGASSAFANHMALDFSKNGNILSRSLSDSALYSALSNDYSFESAIIEFLKIEDINSNDLVIAISASGNSPNIVNALNFCKEKNIETLSLSGLDSTNKSIKLSTYSIYVPMKTYGIVECAHQIFLHLILDNSMKIEEWKRDSSQNMNSSNFNL